MTTKIALVTGAGSGIGRAMASAMILEGALKEGDPLPSVRNVAAEYRVNPLTVLKGYQQLVDEGLIESRRGLGMFINSGARTLLLKGELDASRG